MISKLLEFIFKLVPSFNWITLIGINGYWSSLIWFNLLLLSLNCNVNGQQQQQQQPQQLTNITKQSEGNSSDNLIPIWSTLIDVTCENGLETWNSCLDEAIDYWSSFDDDDKGDDDNDDDHVDDESKRDCCASWYLFNCWSYQVKIVCPDIDPMIQLEQSRIRLSNQSRCIKYYDLSVCQSKPLPIWANILILSFGATLITGLAIFVYWRWIRLI